MSSHTCVLLIFLGVYYFPLYKSRVFFVCSLVIALLTFTGGALIVCVSVKWIRIDFCLFVWILLIGMPYIVCMYWMLNQKARNTSAHAHESTACNLSRCMCMRLFGEIVGGANSIKFNSTYFSAWLRSQFVCMSVCMLSSCVCLNVKRSQNATHEVYGERCCLSGEPNKNLLQENCVSMYGTGGMATVCVLIGSFNNHPKWQTIGWIKYTCWLNYRCNVFTPTSHLHTRIHPYCVC